MVIHNASWQAHIAAIQMMLKLNMDSKWKLNAPICIIWLVWEAWSLKLCAIEKALLR